MFNDLKLGNMFLAVLILIVVFMGSLFIVSIFYEEEKVSVLPSGFSHLTPVNANEGVQIEEIYTHSQVLQIQRKLKKAQSTVKYYQDNACEDQRNRILFTILDKKEKPIESTKVSIRTKDAAFNTYYTDEDGKVVVKLIDNCYIVKIAKSGYNSKEIAECIKRDKNIEIHLSFD